jgi:cellobiose-specific phosphotransferase system component IIB
MKNHILMRVLFLALATGYSQSIVAQQQPAASAEQRDTAQEAKAAPQTQAKIPAGAKVFVAPMGGFEKPFKKAMADKKVPLEMVEQREQAEYEITGASESKKASTAKKVILGSWHSDEDASIKVANLKTGEIVYAYAVHKQDSAHGQRSTAEACAKHLKDEAIAGK